MGQANTDLPYGHIVRNYTFILEFKKGTVAINDQSILVKETNVKFFRLLTIAALVSAFATASFAGSCCSKKKAEKDGQTQTEKKEEAKK